MQVILLKDIDNLGASNELVSVRPGYARNFLIPQKFAVEASNANVNKMNAVNKKKIAEEQALLAEISKVTDALKASPIKVSAKTGTSGKIFGSVTSIQIARAIREQKGYEIDRKRISIIGDVKEIGTHKASVDFGNNNVVELDFEVAGE